MNQADLSAWATYYGLSFPVLQDTNAVTDRLYDPNSRSRPTYVLLGPGAEILSIGSPVTTSAIEAALPNPYP